ncbi:MAG: hypothetical protein PSN37_01385, partial [Alphaproteobacteria bacterium]|nr:hypothetical protein [Alphaproteobacteria bacterium]
AGITTVRQIRDSTVDIHATGRLNKLYVQLLKDNEEWQEEAHFPATIADLYHPETMPGNLRRAHERNDETLERIFIGRRFRNDTERLEVLFKMYSKMKRGAA